MAVVQIYRTDLSQFAAALSAVANTAPSAPTIATANTTSLQSAAVYAVDPAGSYFVVNGFNLAYSPATGRLTTGTVVSIEYYGFGTGSGSYAVFSGLFVPVTMLLTSAAQQNPVATFLSGSNTITADTASLTATGGNDIVTIGGTIPGRVDGGGGIDTAVLRAFRGDTALSGGGGTETVTVKDITTSLVSVEHVQFLDGTVVENASSTQGQAVLAFRAIFGRQPDAINAGGYGALTNTFGVFTAVVQMLATPEGQADTAGLDNGQFVNRIYQNILGRPPTTTEIAVARAPLDGGGTNRAATVSGVIMLAEAATANAGVFAAGVFAASPGAIDTLRAYEVLLGRLPEASSLGPNAAALDQFYSQFFSTGIATESLADLYRNIQSSSEFATRTTPNPYGITAGSSFGAVYAATHSDALTATNVSLVTTAGGVSHLPG